MINTLFIAGLMGVGYWLDGIGPKSCLVDRCLTPWPMGAFGVIVLIGRTLA